MDTNNMISQTENAMAGSQVIFIIVGIFVLLTFIAIIALAFSPRLRGKIMSSQIKGVKYAVDKSEKDIHDISSKTANATADGIKTTTRAIRDGLLKDDETIYCKHCGKQIPADSKFCQSCGKAQ